MNWIELVMIAGLVLFGVIMFRRVGHLEREIEFVRRRNQDRVYELAEEIEKLQEQIRAVRTRVRRSGGQSRFTGDMQIDELVDVHPKALEVLAAFHIGGCSDCAVADDSTVAAAASAKGVDPDRLVSALNGLLEDSADVLDDLSRIRGSGLLQIQTSR